VIKRRRLWFEVFRRIACFILCYSELGFLGTLFLLPNLLHLLLLLIVRLLLLARDGQLHDGGLRGSLRVPFLKIVFFSWRHLRVGFVTSEHVVNYFFTGVLVEFRMVARLVVGLVDSRDR